MKRAINIICITALCYSSRTLAELDVSATAISDYVFNGISQTDSAAAAQIGINYSHVSGVFLGAWGSNVDFKDDAKLEIDYYMGYADQVNTDFSYDISFNYYTYTGYSSSDNVDFGDIKLNLYVHDFGVQYSLANDYFASGKHAHYIAIDYDIALPATTTLTLKAGYSFGDFFKDNEYFDLNATLSKTIGYFDITAAIIDTTVSDKTSLTDRRFVVGIGYQF